MKASWRIGRIAGIDVDVHWTFLLLIAWVLLDYRDQGAPLSAALAELAFVLALFASVVVHELGHALTARRYGIQTRDIILLPIGGVAQLERMPEDQRQEFWVAIAGPLTSLGLSAVLFLVLWVTNSLESLDVVTRGGGSFIESLALANLSLALFNLLPAYPMDGGRVLQALLAQRMGNARAARVAATIGQVMAALIALVGLLYDPYLLLIALFVWTGASQESDRTGREPTRA